MQTPDCDDTADRYVRAPAIDLDGSGLAWGWFWFGLAYFACAQISLGTALLPGGAGILWAPAGLAIAVVLRFGRRLLPGMLLGELMTAVVGGTAPLAALGAGAANLVAVALAAAWLGRLFVPPGWLQRSRDLTLFIGIAALGAPTLGVTLGMASQPTAPLFPLGWLSWWFSHALGVVLVGSLVTAWLDQPKPAAGGRTQFLLVFAANLAIAGLVFSGWLPPLAENFPLMLLLPGLLFAAARLPQRLLILVLLATTVIGILGTAHGFGPFVRPAPLQSQLLLQGFLLLLAAVPLLLRAVLAEGEAANLALAEYRRQLEERVQHATEALRATNEQLEAERSFMAIVQDTVRNLLLVLDRSGRIVVFNRACQALSGYSEDEAFGQRPWQLVAPPAEAAARAAAFATLDAGSFPLCYEDDWLTRDGRQRRIEWANTAILDDAGELLYVVVTGLDVTDRRAAEADVARLNEHVRLLLESAMEGIFGVDPDGRCTFVNPAAVRLLGYPADALLGQAVHPLLQGRHEDGSPYPAEDSLLHRALRERRGFEVQDEVLWTQSGAALPVHYSVNPILDQGRLGGAVVVFRNVAEARALAEHLDYLASHDELTRLHNRRYFDRHLEQALELARVDDDCHILCYLDLDQFKLVNDTCGHIAGDELLRQLGRELRSKVRRGDVLARLGGDEFGVLLQSCRLTDAAPVIEDLRRAICDYRFCWEGRGFTLSVSIGVVQVTAQTLSITAALSAADSACYVAKDAGRNRVHVYEERDVDLTRRHGEMQWVSRLHAALAEERLYLVGQRIQPTRGGSAGLHLEILVRLRDEQGREVGPAAFLPAAERYNLMPAIDRWVIRQTFAWLTGQPRLLQDLELCAINLSGGSVGDAGMRDYIVEQMREHGITPRQICFEITETAAVANLGLAAGFMRELRALGFRFALDDFGSGMSSFAYLKNLPADYLKIDGNFVKDILVDPSDDAMVQAINQVGHVMGLTTVAEFVESPAILERLRSIGVDYAQGFGIALPVALRQFEKD